MFTAYQCQSNHTTDFDIEESGKRFVTLLSNICLTLAVQVAQCHKPHRLENLIIIVKCCYMMSIPSVVGHNLKICQSNLTCCSKQMENELYMESSRVLKDSVHQQTNATHHFLKTQASLFDGKWKRICNIITCGFL